MDWDTLAPFAAPALALGILAGLLRAVLTSPVL